MAETNKRAVAACDTEKLGFLLDPFACSYNPSKDAEALCTDSGGRNTDAVTCLSRKEAEAINKIWYGATTDGSYDANESIANRGGKALGAKQLWWSFPRGADWNGLIGRVGGSDSIALALQDLRYATPGSNIINAGVTERDKWRELDFAGLVDVQRKSLALQEQIGDLNTDNADLSKLQKLGRKVITYTGLGEEVIPPTVSVNHFERVAQSMGGIPEVQKFLRLYLIPAKAHSSQGRAYTVGGNNNAVPLPKMPGANNQTPTREQDQMFSALQDWVENGSVPGNMIITSRDNSVSYPVCVYPLKITWNGKDSSKLASSYACK
jgi:feruloyl esterase